MQKVLKLFLIVFFPLSILAENLENNGAIQGVILNKILESPISDAQIIISDKKIKAVTDKKGRFVINNLSEGIYSLEIHAQGFKEEILQNIQVAQNKITEINVSLNYLEVISEKMVIKPPATVINEPKMSNFRFQSNEVKSQIANYQDPVRALNSLPGVVADGSLNSMMYVRGGEGFGENAFYIDRAYIYYPYHWGNMFTILDPELVDSIDFYAGGFPAEYPYAYSSIIDVTYENGKTKELSGEFISGMHTTSLKLGKLSEDEKFSWIVSGRRTTIDWLMDIGNLESPSGEKDTVLVPYLGEFFTKFKFYSNKQNIFSLSFLHSKDNTRMKIGEEDQQNSSFDLSNFHAYNGYNSYAFDWKHIHTKDAISYLTLSHQNEQVDVEAISENNPYLIKLNPKGYGIRYDFNLVLNEKNLIKTGFNYEGYKMKYSTKINKESMYNNPGVKPEEQNDLDRKFLDINKDISDKTGGLYLQDDIKITDKLKSNIGLRADSEPKKSSESWTYSPRLGVSYAVTSNTIFKTSYGNYYKPSGDFTIDTTENKYKPEQSAHYITGLEHDLGDNIFLRTETYYKDISNILVYDSSFSNKGEGFSYGVEFFLQKKKTDRVKYDGWITYAYAVTKRTANDEIGWYYPQQDQTHTISIVYNYKFSKKFSIGLKENLHTGRPYTPIIGREEIPCYTGEYRPIKGSINSARFSLYHKLDVRLEWLLSEKKNSKTTVFVDFFNLYQHKNIYDYFWNKDYTEKKEIYDEPILPVLFGFKSEF